MLAEFKILTPSVEMMGSLGGDVKPSTFLVHPSFTRKRDLFCVVSGWHSGRTLIIL